MRLVYHNEGRRVRLNVKVLWSSMVLVMVQFIPLAVPRWIPATDNEDERIFLVHSLALS